MNKMQNGGIKDSFVDILPFVRMRREGFLPLSVWQTVLVARLCSLPRVFTSDPGCLIRCAMGIGDERCLVAGSWQRCAVGILGEGVAWATLRRGRVLLVWCRCAVGFVGSMSCHRALSCTSRRVASSRVVSRFVVDKSR